MREPSRAHAGRAAQPVQGTKPATRPTDRLFFAIYPDPSARDRLVALGRALAQRHRLSGRLFAPERLHVTLAMAGDHVGLPDELVQRVVAVGDAVRAAPFAVAVDRVTAFARPRNRPCVLLAGAGVESLRDLHRQLDCGLCDAGVIAAPQRRFRPHLTLLYDDVGLPDEAVEPIGWAVREFRLMRSLLGRSRHVEIARWPLDAPAPG